jgi:hypothetical protein
MHILMMKPSEITVQCCKSCGKMRATKFVAFYRNEGMFFRRREHSAIGYFCKTCIHKYFWTFELKNLVLGPWGMISVAVTPIYFVQNIFNYVGALYKLRGTLE